MTVSYYLAGYDRISDLLAYERRLSLEEVEAVKSRISVPDYDPDMTSGCYRVAPEDLPCFADKSSHLGTLDWFVEAVMEMDTAP